MPRAASNEIEPVEMVCTPTGSGRSPSRMIDPLPNCFSIWPSAISIALLLLFRSSAISLPFLVRKKELPPFF